MRVVLSLFLVFSSVTPVFAASNAKKVYLSHSGGSPSAQYIIFKKK